MIYVLYNLTRLKNYFNFNYKSSFLLILKIFLEIANQIIFI